MPPEFDEHILSTMTDEERATILEQQTPEEIAAIAAIANGDEDGPDDDDEDEDNGDTGAADPAAPAAAAAAPAPAADPAPATPSASDAFQPSYQAKLPDDFAAQESAIKEQNDALAARFKSGDIDFDQYRVEAEALSKSERALDEIRLKATLSQEMTAQTAEQQWNHTVQRFIATTAKDGGIDYSKDPDKQSDLDVFVRTLANDAKNADKPAEWFLAEGHKRVKALHGIGLVTAPPVTDAKNTRKTPLDAAPKTLAQVPGSDGPGDVDGNEFTDVDRLTGDAQEEAIRKMTPAQRERYMSGV
jgi:hypothetical protein